MRRISATAVLLVLALTVLPPACVAGWNDGSGFAPSAKNCEEMPQLRVTRTLCPNHTMRVKTQAGSPVVSHGSTGSGAVQASEQCGYSFAARPGQCRLRSFIQLHFASFRADPISIPLLTATRVASPSRVVIVVSSVGPPETDRGPPRA